MVEKSEGHSVEQLERLYSLLSQCIYQHRREYDKTQLLEVSSRAFFTPRQKIQFQCFFLIAISIYKIYLKNCIDAILNIRYTMNKNMLIGMC